MTSPYQNYAEKYRPRNFKEIIGQEKAIEELKRFLQEFPKKRGLILHGPAGTGKTSLVWAAARENNLEVLELNASDLRNRINLEQVLKPASQQLSLFNKSKILLMDEVDGVTGTADIGGIQELINLIEHTKYPILMTCNDVWQSKLSQLRSKCKLVEMKALLLSVVNEIIKNISEKEGIHTDQEFITKIALKARGDVRAAINDLQSYAETGSFSIDMTEKRDVEDNIFSILKRVFKERQDFLNIYDTTSISLDEILLWLEENIPREYKNETLVRAYRALGNADLFRGRIYRNQSWRFLIYQNIFQSAGISYAKPVPLTGFTRYEPPKRILKIWLHNKKTEKKKTIAKKFAKAVHCSMKRALRDFSLLKYIIKKPEIIKQLKLSEDEIDFLNK